MEKLNEQEPEEAKQIDSIINISSLSVPAEPNKNKSESSLSQKGKISKPRPVMIKAMDVPKKGDSNLLGNVQKEKEKPSIIQRIQAHKKKSMDNNKSNIANKLKLEKEKSLKNNQKSKVQNKSFVVEKLPCAFCNIPITFQQMQNHHNSCKQAFTCDKCKDIFPILLKQQHESVCNSESKIKKQPSYLNHYKNYYDKQEDIDEEQEEFIRQHPQIDPQYLRQYWREQKYNQYDDQDREKEQYNEPQYNNQDQAQNDQQIDQPDYYYNNSEYQSESSKIVKGLKDYQIQDLITDFYRKGQNKQQDQCTICTKQKIQDEIIIRLPCFHTFHKECLVPWLQVKSTCPSCKYNIKFK